MSLKDKSNPKTRALILQKFGGRCAYCGVELKDNKFHADHIVSIHRSRHKSDETNKKGLNEFENYNPSCATCNISKGTMDLEKWRKELVLKIDRVRRDSSTFRMLEKYGMVAIIKTEVKFHFETYNG